MDALTIIAIIGGIAFFAGLFNGITALQLTIPPLHRTTRVMSISIGVLIIVTVLYVYTSSQTKDIQSASTNNPDQFAYPTAMLTAVVITDKPPTVPQTSLPTPPTAQQQSTSQTTIVNPSETQIAQGDNQALPTVINVSPTSRAPQGSDVQSTTMPNQSTIPSTKEEAVLLFGGSSDEWQQLSWNGWKFTPSQPTTIHWPKEWRADFTDTTNRIFSCGDNKEPGVYGQAETTVAIATLWYVPGEQSCPKSTIWSQSHQQSGNIQNNTSVQSASSLPVSVCGDKAFTNGTLLTNKPVFSQPDGYTSGWISSDASSIVLPNGAIERIPDRYVLIVQNLPEVQLIDVSLGNVYGCWYRSDTSIDEVMKQADVANSKQQNEAPSVLSVLYLVSNAEFKRLK